MRKQYDEIIKYATALRLGTAESEAILRRFTRSGPAHPADCRDHTPLIYHHAPRHSYGRIEMDMTRRMPMSLTATSARSAGLRRHPAR